MKPYPHYKASGVPWLGDVPAHWEVIRLRFRCGSNPSVSKALDADAVVSFLPMEAIGEDGSLNLDQTRVVQTVSSGYTYFEDGDVTIAKITPCFENGKGAVMRDLSSGAGFGTTELIVLRPDTRVDPQWLYYFTQAESFRKPGEAMMLGSGGQKRVPELFVRDYRAAFPPRVEQEAIARHLDTETVRVDALIAEKERLMETLRELRQAVVVELSTGLHLPAGATRNPSSCIYGFTPAGWTRIRLGKMVRIRNGSTPLKENAEYWEGGDFPWLNSSVVNGDTVEGASAFVTRTALHQCHLPIAAPGAVLVALTGQGKTRGMAALLKIEATISQHLACITCDPERLNSEYLFWLLTGQYSALRVVSDGQGGTKGALTCEELGRFEILLPPLAVQADIAKQLREQTQRIDELQEHAKAEITLLQELRAATITEAVLGRVKVAGSAVAA